MSIDGTDTIRTIDTRISIQAAGEEGATEPDVDFAMMRERFRTRLAGRREALQAATRDDLSAEGGLRTIKRLAHDLVGSAGTFGFPELGEVAAILEAAATRALLSPEEEHGILPALEALTTAIETAMSARKPLGR
jgi:HPt (histidine-containing phosphotransfer) domain-containing protein